MAEQVIILHNSNAFHLTVMSFDGDSVVLPAHAHCPVLEKFNWQLPTGVTIVPEVIEGPRVPHMDYNGPGF